MARYFLNSQHKKCLIEFNKDPGKPDLFIKGIGYALLI